MDKLDQTRAAREEALNSLEAYIYRSRDFLEDPIFRTVSSDDERISFTEKLEAATEWLFSSDSASLEDFKSKLAELMCFPIITILTLGISKDQSQNEKQIS